MTGIFQAGPKHKEVLARFLQKAPVENTFLLADIEKYGFSSPFQQVWVLWKNGLPEAVYLRFYQNLLVYSESGDIDVTFVEKIASEYDIMIIMGRRVDMNSVLAWGVRAGWQAQHKKLLSLGPAPSLVGTVPGLRKAGPQDADAIYREEIANAGLDREINQYFAALTNMRSVGVMGDERTYDYAIALRAVKTIDFMTAESAQIPYEVLQKVTSRIINEVSHVNRVMYDITSKPPGTIEFE